MLFKLKSPEELEKISDAYDYMKAHPEKYSPLSDEDQPFHHTILPEKTLLRMVPEQECSTFPEEWVPKEIQLVRVPTFMTYSLAGSHEAMYTENDAHGERFLENARQEVGVGPVKFLRHPHSIMMRKIWIREWEFRKPILADHDRFEEVIKNCFNILLGHKMKIEKEVDQPVNMFFLGFMESRRVNQFGYLPNEVMMAARMSTFAIPV